jgi:hypothetical protein
VIAVRKILSSKIPRAAVRLAFFWMAISSSRSTNAPPITARSRAGSSQSLQRLPTSPSCRDLGDQRFRCEFTHCPLFAPHNIPPISLMPVPGRRHKRIRVGRHRLLTRRVRLDQRHAAMLACDGRHRLPGCMVRPPGEASRGTVAAPTLAAGDDFYVAELSLGIGACLVLLRAAPGVQSNWGRSSEPFPP